MKGPSVAKANLVTQDGLDWQRPTGRAGRQTVELDYDHLVCNHDNSTAFSVRVMDTDDSLRFFCASCGREAIRLDLWEQA